MTSYKHLLVHVEDTNITQKERNYGMRCVKYLNNYDEERTVEKYSDINDIISLPEFNDFTFLTVLCYIYNVPKDNIGDYKYIEGHKRRDYKALYFYNTKHINNKYEFISMSDFETRYIDNGFDDYDEPDGYDFSNECDFGCNSTSDSDDNEDCNTICFQNNLRYSSSSCGSSSNCNSSSCCNISDDDNEDSNICCNSSGDDNEDGNTDYCKVTCLAERSKRTVKRRKMLPNGETRLKIFQNIKTPSLFISLINKNAPIIKKITENYIIKDTGINIFSGYMDSYNYSVYVINELPPKTKHAIH